MEKEIRLILHTWYFLIDYNCIWIFSRAGGGGGGGSHVLQEQIGFYHNKCCTFIKVGYFIVFHITKMLCKICRKSM